MTEIPPKLRKLTKISLKPKIYQNIILNKKKKKRPKYHQDLKNDQNTPET